MIIVYDVLCVWKCIVCSDSRSELYFAVTDDKLNHKIILVVFSYADVLSLHANIIL